MTLRGKVIHKEDKEREIQDRINQDIILQHPKKKSLTGLKLSVTSWNMMITPRYHQPESYSLAKRHYIIFQNCSYDCLSCLPFHFPIKYSLEMKISQCEPVCVDTKSFWKYIFHYCYNVKTTINIQEILYYQYFTLEVNLKRIKYSCIKPLPFIRAYINVCS